MRAFRCPLFYRTLLIEHCAKEEMKHLSEEIKDMQRSLSKFLLEYRRLSNSTHIQVTDGEFFEIVEDAKLVKARGGHK